MASMSVKETLRALLGGNGELGDARLHKHLLLVVVEEESDAQGLTRFTPGEKRQVLCRVSA